MERILDHSPTAKPVDLNMKHGSGCFIGFIGLCSVLFCHSPVLGILPCCTSGCMSLPEGFRRISGLADTIRGAKEAQRSNSREFRLRRRPLKKSNVFFLFRITPSAPPLPSPPRASDHLAPHARLENRNWVESSKVAALLLELENLCSVGSKSILFSQWTAFLDLLQIPLSRSNISFVRLDGTLNQQQREKVIKQFSEESHILVLLMSLKAGGVGINLMAASHAFVLDPWWNPAVEEQAVMRIHRIGQTKRVMIKRFIAKGTIQRSALIASKMQSRAT
ncbi:hypothetical protein VitviT2T_020015 [Vitis vinifera]|uniref:Helicase C-terminal domain-containing protein n=1 Tax=Vitis vinifera TaxID=29760 RepID=A0ABY9D323_VITVI|nr:hypothetical protein VitviT2T_020015 [Vitis vinifera]